MDYETEEQQVEALKKWWKENGKFVITGLTLGVALVVGVRFYNQHVNETAESASYLFDQFISADLSQQKDSTELLHKLEQDYSTTPYAALSALAIAQEKYQQGLHDEARQKLEWVIANSSRTEVQHIARLRLMRVLNSMKQYDQSLSIADTSYPDSFAALYEELKGDALLGKGEINLARIAYDKAILSAGVQANRWLKLKRDDLGEIELDEPSS